MVSFVTDYVQNMAAGYLRTGLTAAGTMAGNAVGGVGGLIENSGRAVGDGVSGSIGGVGGYINKYGDRVTGSMAPDGPVGGGAVKKTAVKPGDKKPPASQKALPPTRGPPKSLPAPARKPPNSKPLTSKPPPPSVTGAAGPPKKNPDGKVRVNPQSRPKPSVGIAKNITPQPPNPRPAATGQITSEKNPNGKVRVSAQSRPKPGLR